MRTLTSTLTARQQANSYIAVLKATLTHGATTYTYDLTQIKDLDHTEQPYQQKAEIVLNNSDGALTALDLKGYKLVLSYGMRTPAGEETSDAAPLYVVGQTLNSQEGSLVCVLTAIGLSDILAEDRANDSYIPTSSDTKTVKTLIGEILAATLACYNHCPAYDVVWDSEDSLIDVYQPKDSFRIYIGGSRMAAIRRLLDYTKCVGRFQADGKYHIMSPTTTGTTYDYEYTLEGGHVFFAKAYRKALVIPNYVVVQSRDADSPQYTGYYTDADSITAFREVRNYIQTSLASNAQATAIATAVISKYQMQANMGSAEVPMNCGAEIFDYVKVTDSREGDNRVGNLGSIRRYWRKGAFRMTFSFGGWLSVAGLLSDLEVNSDVGSSLARTTLKGQDIYLDDIVDGTVYAKIKGLHLTGGQLKLDDQVYYGAGYNPTTKELQIERGTTAPGDTTKLWIDTNTTPSRIKRYSGGAWVVCTPKDLDDLPNGTTYSRVNTASLNASGLVLLDQVVTGGYGLLSVSCLSAGYLQLNQYTQVSGAWYDESGVEIDAAHGINIYGTNNALTTRATKTGTIQCYVGSNGAIYAGAGAVKLNASGVEITGKWLFLKSGSTVGDLYQDSSYLRLESDVGICISPGDGSCTIVLATATVVPGVANSGTLGTSGDYWGTAYINVLYYKTHTTFADKDDLALIADLEKGIIPKEVASPDGSFISMGAGIGLALGAINQLADKIMKLEERIIKLE